VPLRSAFTQSSLTGTWSHICTWTHICTYLNMPLVLQVCVI